MADATAPRAPPPSRAGATLAADGAAGRDARHEGSGASGSSRDRKRQPDGGGSGSGSGSGALKRHKKAASGGSKPGGGHGSGARKGASRSGGGGGSGSGKGAHAAPGAGKEGPMRVVVTKGVASYTKRSDLWQRAADARPSLRGALRIKPVRRQGGRGRGAVGAGRGNRAGGGASMTGAGSCWPLPSRPGRFLPPSLPD